MKILTIKVNRFYPFKDGALNTVEWVPENPELFEKIITSYQYESDMSLEDIISQNEKNIALEMFGIINSQISPGEYELDQKYLT